MKITNINLVKNTKYYIILFLTIFLANTLTIKVSFTTDLLTLNLALQKALLSSDDFQVINIYQKIHKISTQGMFFDGENIYESGTIKGINIILKKNYPSNKIIKSIPLGSYIVKGIAKCSNNFYQFSGSQKKILKFSYPELDILTPINIDSEMETGEGLSGLSEDFLVASNGSNKIFILDCKNDLNVIKTIFIENENGDSVSGLKDLVVVGEYIYANKTNDNRILKIDPRTGKVVKFYNMLSLIDFEIKTKSLTPKEINQGSTLSGIAYDDKKKLFIITGRNWGHYYEVELK